MNCDESRAIIESGDLDEIRTSIARLSDAEPIETSTMTAHLRDCAGCWSAASLIAISHERLAAELDQSIPVRESSAIALIAQRKRWYRRMWLLIGAPSIALVAILMILLITKVIVPETRRLLAPPPPVIVGTFPLKCLSPDQAASLLRPYLPQPQNPRWQAESFGVFPGEYGMRVVTVRAPQELIDRVPSLLAELERTSMGACTR